MPSSTRRTHYWLTFAVLAVAVSSYSLMQSLTIPVLSEIERELNTDQNTVTWVLTAYLLSASVFTPIMGRLGDIVRQGAPAGALARSRSPPGRCWPRWRPASAC